MKMERKILLEHIKQAHGRFNTTAGNPVKKILLKLNLSDHRLFKDGGGDFRYSDTTHLSRSVEVLKLKNFKKDATLKLFKNGMSMSVQKSQVHKMAKRLCLVDDLKLLKITMSNTSSRNKLNPKVNDHYNIFTRESQEYEIKDYVDAYKFDEFSKGVIICLYVDDMLIFGTDQVQVNLTKELLSSSFSMKDTREADVILVLEGYTDASWINNSKDNSSTSGWVILLGGGAISWESKKQTCITDSTIEYEFVALAAAEYQGEKKSKTSETTLGSASDGFNLNNEADESEEEIQEKRAMGMTEQRPRRNHSPPFVGDLLHLLIW
ncbi:hypothetical protein Tco_0422894 [Tanacetum coccineum]